MKYKENIKDFLIYLSLVATIKIFEKAPAVIGFISFGIGYWSAKTKKNGNKK